MRELLKNSRVLFILSGCEHCKIYAEVIGLINAKLPMDKKIRIIDTTKYHDYKIVDEPLIEMYAPYTQGSYPSLFIGTTMVQGTHTREELEAWLISFLAEDFVIPENPGHFNKDCRWVNNKFIGRKAICH